LILKICSGPIQRHGSFVHQLDGFVTKLTVDWIAKVNIGPCSENLVELGFQNGFVFCADSNIYDFAQNMTI
jgi:hypothetical protein